MNGLELLVFRVSAELALVALAVALLARVAGYRRARLRAWLWLLVPLKACLILVAAPDLPFGLPVPSLPAVVAESLPARVAGPLGPAKQVVDREAGSRVQGVQIEEDTGVPGRAEAVWHLLAWIWAIGILPGLARCIHGWTRIRRIGRSSKAPTAELFRLYREEAARCRVSSPPKLVIDTRSVGPLVTGGLRPFLILPQWLVEKSSPSQLRWIFRHELAHIRHFDHLSMVLWAFVEIVFWFHPVVWWAGHRWRRAMEQACDDRVADSPSEARHYAEALFFVLRNKVERPSWSVPIRGLSATRTEIGRRIERLLSRRKRAPERAGLVAFLGWVVAASAIGLFGFQGDLVDTGAAPSTRSFLRIDFGPEDQRVEPGWEGWSEDRDRDFVRGFDLDFEVEIDRGPAWRDNGPANDSGRWGSLMRDGMRERDDDAIRITLKDLDRGQYLLELITYEGKEDPMMPAGRFDLMIDGQVLLADQVVARSGSSGAVLPPVSLSSNGGDVVVELVRRGGDIWLNGLILSGQTRWAGDLRLGRIDLEDAPPAVQATIEREVDGAILDDIRRKVRHDDLVYSVDADTPVGDLELEIAPDGTVLERVEEVSSESLSPEITQAIVAMGKSPRIKTVHQVVREEGESVEVEIRIDGNRERLVFDRNGNLLSREMDD